MSSEEITRKAVKVYKKLKLKNELEEVYKPNAEHKRQLQELWSDVKSRMNKLNEEGANIKLTLPIYVNKDLSFTQQGLIADTFKYDIDELERKTNTLIQQIEQAHNANQANTQIFLTGYSRAERAAEIYSKAYDELDKHKQSIDPKDGDNLVEIINTFRKSESTSNQKGYIQGTIIPNPSTPPSEGPSNDDIIQFTHKISDKKLAELENNLQQCKDNNEANQRNNISPNSNPSSPQAATPPPSPTSIATSPYLIHALKVEDDTSQAYQEKRNPEDTGYPELNKSDYRGPK